YRFKPPHFRPFGDSGSPFVVGCELLSGDQQRLLDLRDIGIHRYAQVDDCARPTLRHVADAHDLTMAHVPERAVDIADLRDSNAHMLDDATGEAGVDDVSDADLILGDDEQTVQYILDDVLSAETEACAYCGGEEGERAQEGRRECP